MAEERGRASGCIRDDATLTCDAWRNNQTACGAGGPYPPRWPRCHTHTAERRSIHSFSRHSNFVARAGVAVVAVGVLAPLLVYSYRQAEACWRLAGKAWAW